jgi:hypothetical protein
MRICVTKAWRSVGLILCICCCGCVDAAMMGGFRLGTR